MKPEPLFFATPKELQKWFQKHATTEDELHLGFYKKATKLPSVTWPEAVDEALCVGWIDGVRHRIDDQAYRIRFTPRRTRSHWSDVNIRRMDVLMAAGRVKAAGIKAFQQRTEANSRRAAHEQKHEPRFTASQLKALQKDQKAWAFFESLPPGYRKRATFWVTSAKREDTRVRRLEKLIESMKRQERDF